jgi:hypothetical protein
VEDRCYRSEKFAPCTWASAHRSFYVLYAHVESLHVHDALTQWARWCSPAPKGAIRPVLGTAAIAQVKASLEPSWSVLAKKFSDNDRARLKQLEVLGTRATPAALAQEQERRLADAQVLYDQMVLENTKRSRQFAVRNARFRRATVAAATAVCEEPLRKQSSSVSWEQGSQLVDLASSSEDDGAVEQAHTTTDVEEDAQGNGVIALLSSDEEPAQGEELQSEESESEADELDLEGVDRCGVRIHHRRGGDVCMGSRSFSMARAILPMHNRDNT